MKLINSSTAVGLLLLPLTAFAAPTTEHLEAAVQPIVARDFSPHENCYTTGEQFSDLSDWNNINATVMAGCDTFATYNGHVFGVGDQVRKPPPPGPRFLSHNPFRCIMHCIMPNG